VPGADSMPTRYKGVFSPSRGNPSVAAKAWILKELARGREFPQRPLWSWEFIFCRICTENDPIVPMALWDPTDDPCDERECPIGPYLFGLGGQNGPKKAPHFLL
jgi:hypothetical protein